METGLRVDFQVSGDKVSSPKGGFPEPLSPNSYRVLQDATNMTLIYSGLTGFPNFGVAGLTDIIDYLVKEKKFSMEVYQSLQANKQEVIKNRERLDDPDEISGYIDLFLITIANFSNEIERLPKELKLSVKQQHVISFEQLYDEFINIDKYYCKVFKREHISRKLKDEKLRYLVDMIYADTGNLLYSFRSFGGIRRRLEALVSPNDDLTGSKIDRQKKQVKSLFPKKDKKRKRRYNESYDEIREVAKSLFKEYPGITTASITRCKKVKLVLKKK